MKKSFRRVWFIAVYSMALVTTIVVMNPGRERRVVKRLGRELDRSIRSWMVIPASQKPVPVKKSPGKVIRLHAI